MTTEQCVQYTSKSPDVDFERVFLTLEHLRSNVVRGSANSVLSFILVLQLGSETEVPDLAMHPLIQEDVAELEISVDNQVFV